MRIKPEQLRAFTMVVRLGGVRRAAEHMNLSQPAVTARIQQLEETLAARLFDRGTRGMTLTKRGEAMVRYAEQFLQLSELIERDVADPSGIDRRLRIGVAETIVQSWLPSFIGQLRSEMPLLEIEIAVDVSLNLRESLLNRSIDLAILMGPVSEYSIDNVALPDFPLGWYAGAQMPLPDDPETLFHAQPVVTYARNTRPHRELRTALLDRYGPGARLFPSSSLSACLRMVAAGLGIGALPEVIAEPEAQAGRLTRFDPGWTPAALHFTASYHGEPRSALASRAAQVALEVAIENSDHFAKKNTI